MENNNNENQKSFNLYCACDIIDYYGYDLSKAKDVEKLARFIANVCRKFPEYKIWARIKKRGYERCPLCGKPPEAAKPEVHHEPKTMYEIVYNYIEKLIRDNKILNYTPVEIARDILFQHLNDEVECVTICELCHKEIHNLRKASGEISDE
jgi:hypothetical protein